MVYDFGFNEPKVAPYGSWQSPISSDLIASGANKLGQLVLNGPDVYWVEERPSENGRHVIVKWNPDSGIEEITSAGHNARTRVHEYGGGAFTVHKGDVYFTNFVNQRLYRQYPYTEAEPITPNAAFRFADFATDIGRNRLVCVREDHTVVGQEAVNTLVALNLDWDEEGGQIVVAGNDFYASPRLSPDGSQLVWLTWNHPNMPWDGTELWLADLDDQGGLQNETLVAGGVDESIFQPEWSPDGVLHFVSDRTGWWNLYRWRNGQVESLCEMDAEFGRPQWQFGMSTYGFETAVSIICTYTQHGQWRLARLNTTNGKLSPIEIPYSTIKGIKVTAEYAVLIGGSSTEGSSIIRLDLTTHQCRLLRRDNPLSVDRQYFSPPLPIEFPTENGLTAHAVYYRPHNKDYLPPVGEKPPLIVISHGGPTGMADTMLDMKIQYWTSRGFAVMDVNYGGSSGYGRAYRQRLNGQWGVVDVQDCINAARCLAERNIVDSKRLAIRGGSGGGYTTLCALTFHNIFSAGASHFGVSDVEALAKETHKFESRYLDSMIGPYPEMRDTYIGRSPIHFVDQINCPLILFQGLEDRVVPPNQAEMMFEAVKAKGLPVAYIPFAGEQHGFRRAQNIKRALDGELYFYSRVFDFDLEVPVKPIPIENL